MRLAILLASLFLVAACDSSSPSSPAAESSPSSPAESSPADEARPEAEVLAVFETYVASVSDQDGAGFAAIVAEPTLEHYERLRDLALAAPKAELSREPLGDQIYTLLLRHVLQPDELNELDGRAVAEVFVERGAISEGGVDGVEAGEVSVEGSVARVEASVQGQIAFSYTFRLEPDGWKLDLATLAEGAELAFRQQMEEYGLPEDEYVLGGVKAIVGTTPSRDIWQPPRR
jgi:hypothetical protein